MLGPDQEAIDLPSIVQQRLEDERKAAGWQFSHLSGVDPNDFIHTFPTNVQGVSLVVERRLPSRNAFVGKEQSLVLEFDDEFLRQIIPD